MTGDCICPEHHYKDKDGYPRVKWNKRLWRLNRLTWYMAFGDIPEDMVVCHSCNNKGCVNPNHLYLATHEQNSSDAARDGLYSKPRKFHKDVVDAMIYMYDIECKSQQEIADIFEVSQAHVSTMIRRNR